ncbi:MAG TPA: CotH kinase family protein [Rubricoccaceae bacterium]
MLRRLPFLLLVLVTAAQVPSAQTPDPSAVVYDRASVSRVDLTMHPDTLRWVLDNPLSDREVPADFRFTRGATVETVANVGFRIRGNTSRAAAKKSFKVAFNAFVSGRAWRGLEKLNLNGEHNDPTVARTVLGWGVFASGGVVAARAAHTELWINGAYYGLYANVEQLDETFLGRRFGSEGGFLFKCLYPADLAYRGPTGTSYRHTDGNGRPVYELDQGDDDVAAYDALAAFVAVLNQTPTATFASAIEQAFDVNAFLRALAAEVAVGSWDNYWFNQNNYFLHVAPDTGAGAGRVTYLPYDIDNSFGIDFVSRDWGTRNPYTWGNNTEARPLATRILAVPEFRARYTFYLRRLVAGAFTPAALDPQIAALETLITPAAEADPFRPLDYGYTVADFHRAFREATGAHVEYGLIPYVATRRQTLLAALDNTNVPPILDPPTVAPARPQPADVVTVTARVEDEAAPAGVTLLSVVDAGTTAETPMRDDGAGGDAVVGDGVFTGRLAALGRPATVEIAVRATDVTGQTRTTPFRTLRVEAPALGLVVNEFMASSTGAALRDEAGDADDWIEIHNPTAAPVALLGYTLTDDLANPAKWAFPDVSIPAGGYLIIWADDEAAEGPLHAAFKLGASGEAVGLFRTGVQADAVTFGAQTIDVSTGRSPNATGPFITFGQPSPGAANLTLVLAEGAPLGLDVRAFPNPFRGLLTVETGAPLPDGAEAAVYDALGRLVARLDARAGATRIRWDARDVPAGVYVVRVTTAGRGGAAGDVHTLRVVRQ